MNKSKFIHLFIGLLLVPIMAWAQDDSSSSPPPHLILAPEGDMKWTISIQPKGSTESGTFDPSLLEYSHSDGPGGKWTRLAATYGASMKTEWWLTQGLVVNQAFGSQRVMITAYVRAATDGGRQQAIAPAPYGTAGFFGIENVNPADDRGNRSPPAGGTLCRYYTDNPNTESSDPSSQQNQPSTAGYYEAWFDLKTGLPKAYRKGGKTYLYEFFPTTPAEVQPPPDFVKAMENYRSDLQHAQGALAK